MKKIKTKELQRCRYVMCQKRTFTESWKYMDTPGVLWHIEGLKMGNGKIMAHMV